MVWQTMILTVHSLDAPLQVVTKYLCEPFLYRYFAFGWSFATGISFVL